jgi:hypothetical protein
MKEPQRPKAKGPTLIDVLQMHGERAKGRDLNCEGCKLLRHAVSAALARAAQLRASDQLQLLVYSI